MPRNRHLQDCVLTVGLLCLGAAVGIAFTSPSPELVVSQFTGPTGTQSPAVGAAATGGAALTLWATERADRGV